MIKVETQVRGNILAFETGVMARQAGGATVLKYGDTLLLSTAVSLKDAREGIDFFPLTIDYLEKTYAAGKIPGGFFKREGRLSEKETLTSRLIDRPIRPLFPKGFKCETQGIVNVLSFGPENVADVLGIVGMSASLMISDIPFDGPVSAVRIGKKGDEFIIFPNLEEIEDLDLQIVVAGTDDAVAMVEGMASEASEDDFLEAIDIAHAEIKKINTLQREFREKAGKPKREFTAPSIDPAIVEKVTPFITEKLMAVIKIKDKLERQDAVGAVLKEALEHFSGEEVNISSEVSEIFFKLEKKLFRDMVINENVRADGRKPDEIRQINSQVGLLPRAHGSALFTRGETQALAVVTLGTRDDEQRIDALEGDHFRKFMLHYNFPPFSVGEAKFLRGPGRREIGHGSLAEKAIRPMLPTAEEWPYTMRVVSEVLESNGSSSMATVCGTTLSLMDAGVPIKAPVAGIAMGLIKEGDKAVILSDIMGLEDHLGDLDFKVTGTRTGITAFQMDSKLGGIDRELMSRALEQAKNGRLHILDKMHETIETPRDGLSPHAPRIFTLMIKQDKIRDIIGPGGKIIKQIIEETGTKINVEDSGLVSIASSDEESAQRAIDIIRGITADPELNRIYKGKVVRITDFGAFVEILPGTDGLLHISQIDSKRVEKVTDVLSEGDEVDVKVIEIDKLGRVRLSRKDALKELAEKK